MTERECAIVILTFTGLVDKLRSVAPDQLDIGGVYAAGKILQKEIELTRSFEFNRKTTFFRFKDTVSYTNPPDSNWQKKNDELEKKKERERQNAEADRVLETRPQDLEGLLKQSIENAKKDRQEG